MRIHRVMTLSILLICGILLHATLAWPSTTKTILPVDEERRTEAPAPSTPLKEDRIWDIPRGLGWENQFFDKPLAQYIFSKNTMSIPTSSSFSIKSPGRFPGIELGIEMHSVQALQQVVPPDRLSKSLDSEQNQPRLLSPTANSPDYNGGFLRFTW